LMILPAAIRAAAFALVLWVAVVPGRACASIPVAALPESASVDSGPARRAFSDTTYSESPAALDTVPAPRDTATARPAPVRTDRDSLDRFLHSMSDSTDRYFGMSSAPSDTAGNDSALAEALANPRHDRRERWLTFSPRPDFTFNRVD